MCCFVNDSAGVFGPVPLVVCCDVEEVHPIGLRIVMAEVARLQGCSLGCGVPVIFSLIAEYDCY